MHDFGALNFDRRAEFDQAEVQKVHEAVRDSGIQHLYVLAHGAHNDEAMTKATDDAFREMLAEAWADTSATTGFLTVRWPSLCFRDEGIPGVAGEETQREREASPGISETMLDDLVRQLPDSTSPLTEIAALFNDEHPHDGAFDDLGIGAAPAGGDPAAGPAGRIRDRHRR